MGAVKAGWFRIIQANENRSDVKDGILTFISAGDGAENSPQTLSVS